MIQGKIRKIKGIFSEGRLIGIYGKDWMKWKDQQIFNEEQRALGEGMLTEKQGKDMVIGFGKFQELVSSYQTDGKPLWLQPAFAFLNDMQAEKEFRKERILYLLKELKELLQLLNPDKYEDTHAEVLRIISQTEESKLIDRLEEKNKSIY